MCFKNIVFTGLLKMRYICTRCAKSCKLQKGVRRFGKANYLLCGVGAKYAFPATASSLPPYLTSVETDFCHLQHYIWQRTRSIRHQKQLKPSWSLFYRQKEISPHILPAGSCYSLKSNWLSASVYSACLKKPLVCCFFYGDSLQFRLHSPPVVSVSREVPI